MKPWLGRLLAVLGGFAITQVALLALVGSGHILYNRTESMPIGLYVILPWGVERGATVAVCLPSTIRRQERTVSDATWTGRCEGDPILLKSLAAVAGDTVRIGASVCVRGERLAHSSRLARDGNDRLIPQIARGVVTLPVGQAWLASDADYGWDSRYYGAVPVTGIVGRAFYVGAQPQVAFDGVCPRA